MADSNALQQLQNTLKGSLDYSETIRHLYATDASAYREIPEAVAFPADTEDLKRLIHFANETNVGLIPRTAGTSLAGQVVGHGIIVDVSRHFDQILELNAEEKWVKVQPGVVRDELNQFLKAHGLLFGPETSTANRAMIGGMVGNNSCGSNSILYGSTREHLLEIKCVLSDGTECVFGDLSVKEFDDKCAGKTSGALEQRIYCQMRDLLSQEGLRQKIRDNYAKPSIPRRNNGYALDMLMDCIWFDRNSDKPFNFCKLIAGSEGTLAFITEIKVGLNPLPPAVQGLLCIHSDTVDDALRANLLALKHQPSACELMDHYLLDCTKDSHSQKENRFFLKGSPGAILVVEFHRDSREEIERIAKNLETEITAAGWGYHFPLLFGDDVNRVWSLRKAGLGLLSNIKGDAKPVPVIEDTAVDVQDLPEYIAEFALKMKEYGLYCVHYAHAGSGELHLRPVLNLKTEQGRELFKTVATEIAILVKKYKGCLSGEHGDGRLRGEFIPFMLGEEIYQVFCAIKDCWDPNSIFNPGKIVRTASMNSFLRYGTASQSVEIKTAFDFSNEGGFQQAVEMCNGSADCRKSHKIGGTMCPSFMVSHKEEDTTRARANMLREMMNSATDKNHPLSDPKIDQVMDLCIQCKGCKGECPSNVDMAKIKSEWLFQKQKNTGIPFLSKTIAHYSKAMTWAGKIKLLYNLSLDIPLVHSLIKKSLGLAKNRSIPHLSKQDFMGWYRNHDTRLSKLAAKSTKGSVVFFADEFTRFTESELLIKSIELLATLGYTIKLYPLIDSGRSYISKGMLDDAKWLAEQHSKLVNELVKDETALVGIEPSALLCFRDELPDLVRGELKQPFVNQRHNILLFDEFLAREIDKGNIKREQFKAGNRRIRLHGHCHQKAIGSMVPLKKVLSLPAGNEVVLIPSGCCGMAGSFGMEETHYEFSMKIGELVLFPTIRSESEKTVIVASGSSCRQQIADGTGRTALHPVEILHELLA